MINIKRRKVLVWTGFHHYHFFSGIKKKKNSDIANTYLVFICISWHPTPKILTN
jgi:hypothetical protein